MGGGGGAWIYPAAQIGGCHEAAASLDLIHFDQPVCKTAKHVRSVAEMTCLLLIQLGHCCESIRSRGMLDHRPEGLHGRGVRLEESDFGIATPCSLIKIPGIGSKRPPTWAPRGICDAHGPTRNSGQSMRLCLAGARAGCPRQPHQPGPRPQRQLRISW